MGSSSDHYGQIVTPAPIKVNIVQSPFYTVQKKIVPPKLLTSQKGNVTLHQIDFFIPNEFAATFQGPPSDSLPRYELQMRMVLNKPDEEQFDTFPDGIKIKMNGKEVVLPIVASKLDHKVLKPNPVDLTSYLIRDSEAKQQMLFEWKENERDFVVGLWIVHHIDLETLHQKFIAEGAYHYKETKNMIQANLTGLADEDGLTVDSLKILLLCPITRKKIMTPIRSQDCDHIQCFDLDNYLQSNLTKSTWECPICNKKAPYHSLVFDIYIGEIIQKVDDNVTGVELMTDGSWKVAEEEQIDEITQISGDSQKVAVQLKDTMDAQVPGDSQQVVAQLEDAMDDQVPDESQKAPVQPEVIVNDQVPAEVQKAPVQPEAIVDDQVPDEPQQLTVQLEDTMNDQVPEEVQKAPVQPEATVEEQMVENTKRTVPRKRKHDSMSINDFDFE